MFKFITIISVFLAGALAAIQPSAGLDGTIIARVTASKSCPKGPLTQAPRICQRASCSLNYYIRAIWSSQIYGSSTGLPCTKICARHAASCNAQCETLADQHIIEGSNICQCTRRASAEKVLVPCFQMCSKAHSKCRLACLPSIKCNRSVTTIASWTKNYDGFCGVKCNGLSVGDVTK